MSIFNGSLFENAPIEAKVIDWNFTDLLAFLKKLKPHSETSTRDLRITIEVLTPAANYSPQRFEWLANCRLALGWYLEDPLRYVNFEEDPYATIRLKIAEQFFDVKHVIRFPASDFTIRNRSASAFSFSGFLRTHCRRQGIRLHKFNNKLEELLIKSSAQAEWVQRYWTTNGQWQAKLQGIQRHERARMARAKFLYGYWNKNAIWLGRLAEIRQDALEARLSRFE